MGCPALLQALGHMLHEPLYLQMVMLAQQLAGRMVVHPQVLELLIQVGTAVGRIPIGRNNNRGLSRRRRRGGSSGSVGAMLLFDWFL